MDDPGGAQVDCLSGRTKGRPVPAFPVSEGTESPSAGGPAYYWRNRLRRRIFTHRREWMEACKVAQDLVKQAKTDATGT